MLTRFFFRYWRFPGLLSDASAEQLLAEYCFMDPIFDRLLHVRRGMLVFCSLSDNLWPRVESTFGYTGSEYGGCWHVTLCLYPSPRLLLVVLLIFSFTTCRLGME